jgi:hypothetical protein
MFGMRLIVSISSMLVRASVWFVEMPPPLVREKIPLNKVGYKYTEFFW